MRKKLSLLLLAFPLAASTSIAAAQEWETIHYHRCHETIVEHICHIEPGEYHPGHYQHGFYDEAGRYHQGRYVPGFRGADLRVCENIHHRRWIC